MVRILAFLILSTASLSAWEDGRVYIGAFGGGIHAGSSEAYQLGTAFFTEIQGGPLAVGARGDIDGGFTGFGGVQVGYEWSSNCNQCSNWSFVPATEFEAFFFCQNREGHLINPTDRLEEHDFLDSFHLHSDILLVNGVFALENCSWCGLSPYVGGGIGAARISISDADSLQVEPPEAGVNHFNSLNHDSSWAFAAQVKAGLRYNLFSCLQIFGEYRYVFVDSSNYIFGSTVSPGHAATSPWNVKINNTQYNAFAIGLKYSL